MRNEKDATGHEREIKSTRTCGTNILNMPSKILETAGLLPRGKGFSCQVVLLDNATFQTRFEKYSSTNGEDLFDRVCAHLKLPDKDKGYFGLQFTEWEDGELNWLEMGKDVRLQRSKPHCFQFAVKFYPRIASHLGPTARELLCLQIKDFLARGKFVEPVSVRLHAILDGYFAQFWLGDYTLKKHATGYLESLLGRFFMAPNGLNSDMEMSEKNYEAMVFGVHKSQHGKTREEAVLAFLEVATTLPFYGIYIHKGATDNQGNPTLLGTCEKGILVYSLNDIGAPGKLQHEILWKEIVAMYQNKHKLLILTLDEEQKDAKKFNFRFHGHFAHRKAKRAARDAMRHQQFFNDTKKDPRNRASSFTEPDSIARKLQEIERTERKYATFNAKCRRKSAFGRFKNSLKHLGLSHSLSRSNSTEPSKVEQSNSTAEPSKVELQSMGKRASIITIEEFL